MSKFLRHLSLLLLCFMGSCAENISVTKDRFVRTPVGFSELPGWEKDQILKAIPALAQSCSVLDRKPAWSGLCTALKTSAPQSDQQARQFFERWFQPYAVEGKDGEQGLFTGYYEAELQGSRVQEKAYQVPLYARPDDLVMVDLGKFKTDLHGQKITGKVVASPNGKYLEPYDDRSTIVKGSLTGRAQPLVWVNNPVDAFFLAIQGSGRVHLNDDSVVRLGYDATNSRPYVAIGRILADRNEIAKPVTMQSIRVWMQQHPEKAAEVMNLNTSYVFFRILKSSHAEEDSSYNDGPLGAEGVALTPQRSLAIDPGFIDFGTPVWLDTFDGQGTVLQRLVIAQDTGGAIKGAVRGDVFWGFGKEAEDQAGAMQSKGRYFILLPRNGSSDAHF